MADIPAELINNGEGEGRLDKEQKDQEVQSEPQPQTLSDVSTSLTSLMSVMQTKMRELEQKETWWADIERRMKIQSEAASKKVTLDVGGKRFVTTKETLLSCKGSFFDAMLSSGHWLPDADGVYFIDRSPELFPIIMDFMRYGEISLAKYTYDITDDLKRELDFYQISIPEINCPNFGESLILKNSIYTKTQLLYWIGNEKTTLLYRATRDGFDAATFHKLCDQKGATVVVIKTSEHQILGGYTSAKWESHNRFKLADECFTFTTHPLRKYPMQNLDKAIYCAAALGPVFGSFDIYISNNSNHIEFSPASSSSSSSTPSKSPPRSASQQNISAAAQAKPAAQTSNTNTKPTPNPAKLGSYSKLGGVESHFLVSEIEVFLVD